MRRCAGSQFDPVVGEAFCSALARHGRDAAPVAVVARRAAVAVA